MIRINIFSAIQHFSLLPPRNMAITPHCNFLKLEDNIYCNHNQYAGMYPDKDLAYIIVFFLIIGAIVLTYRKRLNSLQRESGLLAENNQKLQDELSRISDARQEVLQVRSELTGKDQLLTELQGAAESQKERAERSEKFKHQFLANMSHEMRTPMNAVNGMTEILLRKNPRPDQLQYLEIISKSADSLIHIINDLFDLSKIEAGRLELEEVDFSMTGLVKQVKETLFFKAEEKGLQLITRVKVDGDDDVMLGDPYRLSQVLLNLGSNAIKFTEKGSIEILVDSVKTPEGKNAFNFSVIDTGIGIPQDKIGGLFQSFNQVNNSDSRKYGGTGLGLSIAKQLVDLHKGTIAVESKPGIGTHFSFSIDYVSGSAHRMAEKQRIAQNADGAILNGLRILLADDNDYNRMVVVETLKLKADVEIDEAVNGLAAIELMKNNRYDLVLMDIQMPEMNGYDAVKYIREQLPAPKNAVPVIAFTASLLRSDIEMCLKSGMNTYIAKPFKVWQLISAISSLTGRKIESRQNATIASAPAPFAAGTLIADLAFLSKFCEGNEDRIKKYIKVFIAAVPVFKEKIGEARKEMNLTEIALQVHSFKPKWMMMGMKQCTELGQKIEALCKEGNSTDAAPNLDVLLDFNSHAVQELQDKI